MNLASPPLSNFTPPLPESLVTSLSALNIRTAPDFIFVPPAELLRKLPAGSVTFPELARHIAHVRNAFAGPALTGDQLIGESEARAQLPSVLSGLPALDGLVGNSFGGASGGRVVEISGAGASGKTALALHIILHHLELHPTDAALWLDTTGNLAPARLSTLASRSRNETTTHQEPPLTRLNVVSTFDTATAARTIKALDTEGGGRPESHARQFRIVVLDTVTALLGPHLSGISSQGNAQQSRPTQVSEHHQLTTTMTTWGAPAPSTSTPVGHADMTMFMRLLRAAAQKHGLCILVLNDATAAGRPALGASFTFMTDVTLWLERAPGQDRELRTAEVLRSRVSMSKSRCTFRIRQGRVLASSS